MNSQDTATAAPATNVKRKKWMIALTVVFAGIGVAYGGYWIWCGRYSVATDNAYVSGNIVQITPQISGTVLSVNADDTDLVKVGTPLVRLDEADAKLLVDQAEAQLAQTVREVRTLYANNDSLSAIVAQRETDLNKQRRDLERRRTLEGTGAIASEEIEHAREAVLAAESALTSAREQQHSNHALIDNTTVVSHPNVQRAAAHVREQYLAWQRATITAPVTGYIAKRNVQVGQRVKAGDPLMALVPLEQVWVDANFKEIQIREMRIGQPVRLNADVYGKNIVYHGKIVGFSAGTGTAFSLLPAQNATGNWIKVVQRLPVRISLDPKELAEHPLQVGLSMAAEVDVTDKTGGRLSSGSQRGAVAQSDVPAFWGKEADLRVQQLIAANCIGSNKRGGRSRRDSSDEKTKVSSEVTSPRPLLPSHVAFATAKRL